MNKKPNKVTLIIPGLLDAFSGIDPELFPELPALATLLGKGNSHGIPKDNFETTVCRLFHLSVNESSELPIAQLTWLADFGSQSATPLLRADPVHLQPDRAELRLFPADSLAITTQETEQLLVTLNEQYRSDGHKFISATTTRWYLRPGRQPSIRTRPLSEVAGKDVRSYLPSGDDSAYWKTLFNEIQMLLHAHPVNQRRRDSQQAVINSLWFWGGAPLPVDAPSVEYTVIGKDSLTEGLAKLSGSIFNSAETGSRSAWHANIENKNCLIVCQDLQEAVVYGEFNSWEQLLIEFEQALFNPLLADLKKGDLSSVDLLPCNGRLYQIKRNQLFKFWQSARSFKTYLKQY